MKHFLRCCILKWGTLLVIALATNYAHSVCVKETFLGEDVGKGQTVYLHVQEITIINKVHKMSNTDLFTGGSLLF